MTKFEALFGIKEQSIKRNCILLPFLPKGILAEFKIKNLSKGKIYSTASSDDLAWLEIQNKSNNLQPPKGGLSLTGFTLIYTGMGPTFVGDALLYLKQTPCQNVILFGSCGLVTKKDGLSIGDLVLPFKCYSDESFSQMLLGNVKKKAFYPDKKLFESFMHMNKDVDIKRVMCSTISSLKLEEDLVNSFKKEGIDVVDMECSAFFSAAKFVGLKALALFYITDILRTKPFYVNLDDATRQRLLSSIKTGVELIYTFKKEYMA